MRPRRARIGFVTGGASYHERTLTDPRFSEWFTRALYGVDWEARPTNFWWWREGLDPGICPLNFEHPLWRMATPGDLTWHFHGVLYPPPGATSLLAAEHEGTTRCCCRNRSGDEVG